MFHQLLTPVGDSLGLSFLVAVLPVLAVLLLLGVLRRPAWQAALAGLIVGLIIAVFPWRMPIGLALHSTLCGATFALWPVMWIVINALLLYNIAVRSGRFDAFRTWVVTHLPNDRRVVLVVVGFCFGALLEGIAGFGTPVAITSSLLILVGYPALEALVFVLIFNTAPVAFGVNWKEPLPLYYLILFFAALSYMAVVYISRAPFGLALQGVRDNPRRMEAIGYNVTAHRVAAYAFAALIASIGGILMVWLNNQISPGSAGIEATISQAVTATGARHARYRGLPKTRLQHAYTAVAINLWRLHAYWNDTPIDRTRSSHLARLNTSLRDTALPPN